MVYLNFRNWWNYLMTKPPSNPRSNNGWTLMKDDKDRFSDEGWAPLIILSPIAHKIIVCVEATLINNISVVDLNSKWSTLEIFYNLYMWQPQLLSLNLLLKTKGDVNLHVPIYDLLETNIEEQWALKIKKKGYQRVLLKPLLWLWKMQTLKPL